MTEGILNNLTGPLMNIIESIKFLNTLFKNMILTVFGSLCPWPVFFVADIGRKIQLTNLHFAIQIKYQNINEL